MATFAFAELLQLARCEWTQHSVSKLQLKSYSLKVGRIMQFASKMTQCRPKQTLLCDIDNSFKSIIVLLNGLTNRCSWRRIEDCLRVRIWKHRAMGKKRSRWYGHATDECWVFSSQCGYRQQSWSVSWNLGAHRVRLESVRLRNEYLFDSSNVDAAQNLCHDAARHECWSITVVQIGDLWQMRIGPSASSA